MRGTVKKAAMHLSGRKFTDQVHASCNVALNANRIPCCRECRNERSGSAQLSSTFHSTGFRVWCLRLGVSSLSLRVQTNRQLLQQQSPSRIKLLQKGVLQCIPECSSSTKSLLKTVRRGFASCSPLKAQRPEENFGSDLLTPRPLCCGLSW